VAETVEQRYDRLSKEMAKFEEMVPDVVRDEPDASSSDKMKRRYVNKTRKAVEYFRDRHPKYKSLLKQLESIEAKWDKEGKHM
jgi:type I site-specific restriction-modification system R (restriction) subunit